MMRYFFLILTILINLEAHALVSPKGSAFDSRIQHVNYNENDVVEVNSYPAIATQIVFSEGETVEEILDIASGYTEGWEFIKRRNNLYLKPKTVKKTDDNGNKQVTIEPVAEKWNTNLLIATNLRLYTFQLVLHEGRQDEKLEHHPKIAYRIQFKYPKDMLKKAQSAQEKRILEKRLEKQNAPRNWNYTMKVKKGSEEIAPSMAYDDGRFTYLKFPGNGDFPAVYSASKDKTESLVNSHIDPSRPDVLVIHRVATQFMLRAGKRVVGVFNENYNAYGVPPIQGTTVEGVKRIIRKDHHGIDKEVSA